MNNAVASAASAVGTDNNIGTVLQATSGNADALTEAVKSGDINAITQEGLNSASSAATATGNTSFAANLDKARTKTKEV